MNARSLLEKPLGEALEQSAKVVQQNSRRIAGSPPIVNTGELARGIDVKKQSRLSYRVGADAKYSPFVEHGRSAGRMPPVAAIERWASTKLGAPGAGFAIARKIAQRGTKAQPFFEPGIQNSMSAIRHLFDGAIDAFIRAL